MSLSDSAARTQGKSRETLSTLCDHLGLNVIRTPVVHVTKQMINNYLLENVPAVRVLALYIVAASAFDLFLLLPALLLLLLVVLLLTRFIAISQCIWVFQLFKRLCRQLTI